MHSPKHTRYLDEFLSLNCRDDLLPLGFFGNSRKITESFGAFNAVRRHLRLTVDLTSPRVSCVVLENTSEPRTGTVMAFRSAWSIHSDSQDFTTRALTAAHKVSRLWCNNNQPQNLQQRERERLSHLVVMAIGPRSSLLDTVREAQLLTSKPISLVVLGKLPDNIADDPDVRYTDPGILSHNNTVRIWKHI